MDHLCTISSETKFLQVPMKCHTPQKQLIFDMSTFNNFWAINMPIFWQNDFRK